MMQIEKCSDLQVQFHWMQNERERVLTYLSLVVHNADDANAIVKLFGCREKEESLLDFPFTTVRSSYVMYCIGFQMVIC